MLPPMDYTRCDLARAVLDAHLQKAIGVDDTPPNSDDYEMDY